MYTNDILICVCIITCIQISILCSYMTMYISTILISILCSYISIYISTILISILILCSYMCMYITTIRTHIQVCIFIITCVQVYIFISRIQYTMQHLEWDYD